MDFRRGQLLYFVTVAEEGQITRAAARLHIAQPALSHAIAQLESDLGLVLLERHARGVGLTPAGATFLAKAKVALAAWTDAFAQTRAHGQVPRGTIDFGFLGAAPGLDSPQVLALFSAANPEIELRFLEVAFPSAATARWLADVDVAVCHRPPADPAVWTHEVRREPRVALVPTSHPLSDRRSLSAEQLLDEVFVSLHPSVEPAWAGFWSLDDVRGGPPRRTTTDHALRPQEVLAAVAVARGVTTVPASVGRIVSGVGLGVATIPLLDAQPATIMLVGHRGRTDPCVAALREFAEEVVVEVPPLDGARFPDD